MADAQPSAVPLDVQAVLDKVWDDLLDHMELDSVLDLLAQTDGFKRSELRDIKEQTTTTTYKIRALLDCIQTKGSIAYVHFKQSLRKCGQEILADMLEAAEKDLDLTNIREKMKTEAGKSPATIKLLRDLKEDLIRHYKNNESTMPVAPLVEEHETKLLNFYVRPPMMAYNKPNAFGQKKEAEKDKNEKWEQDKENTKTEVNSYRELLFEDREPFKKIYVSADAGMGKTSFSKMLAQTWCQACKPDKSLEKKFNYYDVKTMGEFDFLFLIYLREYQGTDECSIEGMVLHMLKHKLAKASSYSIEFLEQVLNDKRCLIVVDGFDEWVHPKACTIEEANPHIRNYKGCSVLTTTRPWKLSTARLKTSSIDRHVEISQLDKKTSDELESLAIQFLDKNQEQNSQRTENATPRTSADFDKEISQTGLGDLRYIPYILLQLICLWFQRSSLGRSMCEIYSNIIELTLQRGLNKIDRLCKNCQDQNCSCRLQISPDQNTDFLKCMTNNKTCAKYMQILKKIGRLAFFALFGKIKEKTLFIDKEDVLNYLDKSEIEFCLRVGLLSQVTDTCQLAGKRFFVLFQHKSVQEFLAALYISTRFEDDIGENGIKETIISACKSVSDILQMSNVFKFVCGMKPDVYSCISRSFQAVVDSDQMFIEYRSCEWTRGDYRYKTVRSYQSMQVDCLHESVRNGYNQCDVVLSDVIVDEDYPTKDTMTVFKSLLTRNSHNIKSFSATFYEISEYLDRTTSSSLESLSLPITYISSSYFDFSTHAYHVVDYCFDVVTLSNLQCIHFTHLHLSHDYRKRLYDYISSCTLTHLHLYDIDCSTCSGDKCPGLDLSKSNQLQYLYLRRISGTDIISGPQQCLITCKLYNLTMSHCNIQKLFDSFENTIVLTVLECEIECLDHGDNCPGFFKLNLSKQNQLKTLSVEFGLHVRSVALTQLYVNTEHLEECRICLRGSDNISSVLAQLQDAPVLSSLKFRNIRDPPARMQIPKLRQLTDIELWDLADSSLTLHPEMTSLERIMLHDTKMSMSSWRELFLSISNLPQPITVVLWRITMTTAEWRELFLSISNLPQPITVTLRDITMTTAECRELLFNIIGELPKVIRVAVGKPKGQSDHEWYTILQDMKSSPAFSILNTVWDTIEFINVVS